jgi:hypothetical protein
MEAAVARRAAVVESVVSKLQETGQHVAKKSDLLFSRTRDAGGAFIGEVRHAGREIVGLVRTEAKGWRRFLAQQTSRFQVETKAVFTPKTLERELLSRIDGTLRSLDQKVRERLGALEKRPTKKPARRKARTRSNGKARPAVPAAKAATKATSKSATNAATIVAGARH